MFVHGQSDTKMVEKTMPTRKSTMFGTRGSRVRITPLRPSSAGYGNENGNDCYPTLKPATIDRFWGYVSIGSDDECWEWQAGKNPEGYGKFRVPELRLNAFGAHRISYMLNYGSFPAAGLVVRHKCDNPGCVNPHHLESGTHKDNSDDAKSRGRLRNGSQSGAMNGNAKLNEALVSVIRLRIANGETNKAIAKDFRVSHAMISRIRKGKAWSHV
jgi:hypothetical protein